jgi:hypothetical protein
VMKIICAWCGKLLGHKCPFCGDPLSEPRKISLQGTYKECRNEMTPILIRIANMQTTHSLCDGCAGKPRGQTRTPRHGKEAGHE